MPPGPYWQAANGKNQSRNLNSKLEILKHKIDQEIITSSISFYYAIHSTVPIYEHFPYKNTIFKPEKLVYTYF